MLRAEIDMQKGTLDRWNDEKGFGFIRPENGEEDVFFHISSLQVSQRRPIQGDTLYFNIEIDVQGRKKATEVGIDGMKSVFKERAVNKAEAKCRSKPASKTSSYRSRSYQAKKTSGRFVFGVSMVFVILLILFAVDRFNQFKSSESYSFPSETSATNFETEYPSTPHDFKCEGKTRCNQMTSCDEAMFYLNHCPGSVTDGDGDGRPCEDQWCGH